MTIVDQYFQDALWHLSGTRPPTHFKLEPSSDAEADEQQEWAINHVRPTWACGISLLEAARACVEDARGNGNILSPRAPYAAAFEIAAREKGAL